MDNDSLKNYKIKLGNLSVNEQKMRDLYLRKLALGEIQGPPTGYASIDKPWLKIKHNDRNMPDDDMSVYDFLYECNKEHLDDIALIYDPSMQLPSNDITFREFFNRIDECAKAYTALGIKKGDIVTVSLPSFVENIVSFYALNKIGAVTNQIHPLASRDELEFYLDEAESSIFLGYGDVFDTIKTINNKNLRYVILVSPYDSMDLKAKEKLQIQDNTQKVIKFNNLKCISWQNFIQRGKKIDDSKLVINHNSNSLTALTHTSGTTGKSKAVMTTSYAFNSSVVSILDSTALFERHDKELLILPPFPLYILNNVVHLSLCAGEQLVVIPKVDYSKF